MVRLDLELTVAPEDTVTHVPLYAHEATHG